MRRQANVWWPERIRQQRNELERQASALIRAADRKSHNASNGKKAKVAKIATFEKETAAQPRRWRLADLRELRRMGKVP